MGYVYFIGSEDKVKIGFTKHSDINKRLKQLQTGSKDELKIIYYIEGTMETEKFLHRLFENDRLRKKSEWFNYSYAIKRWIINHKYLQSLNK